MRFLTTLGDRVLARFVPKTVAAASEASTQATWSVRCYCHDSRYYYKICDSFGGVTTCGPCSRGNVRC